MTTTSRPHLSVVPPVAGARWQSRQLVLGTVATASVVAGAIHLAVVPEHLEEWWVYGAFFVATAVFQVGFAVVLWRRLTPALALSGIVVNLGIVLTWVLSRTLGLPLTPPEDGAAHEGSHAAAEGAHAVEAVGAADLVATGAELLVVCLLVTLLPRPLRQRTVDVLLVTGVALWVLRVSGALG